MKKSAQTITSIPFFPGYYESIFNSFMDAEIEREAEDISEDHELDVSDVVELIYSNYTLPTTEINEMFVDKFNGLFYQEATFDLSLSFESMESPREYNFTSDTLFANIDTKKVSELWTLSEDENHITLKSIIRDRFTSCDGFISFYSNDISEWEEKPLSEWDHNEIGTLIEAVAIGRDSDFSKNLTDEILDEYELFSQVFDSSVNWKDFEKGLKALKAA